MRMLALWFACLMVTAPTAAQAGFLVTNRSGQPVLALALARGREGWRLLGPIRVAAGAQVHLDSAPGERVAYLALGSGPGAWQSGPGALTLGPGTPALEHGEECLLEVAGVGQVGLLAWQLTEVRRLEPVFVPVEGDESVYGPEAGSH